MTLSSRGGAGDRVSFRRLFPVVLQVGLVVAIIHQFQIESRALLRISVLTLVGFVLHSQLPSRWRMPFFLALSLLGLLAVMGARNAAWLTVIGLSLIGLTHLPIAQRLRIGLLCLAALLLASLRLDWLHAPFSSAVWPILGSIFMFRMIIYLYDRRHEDSPAPVSQALSYFFLLPNACFALFPVVDYKTFRRTYFDDEALRIYRSGALWMARGVLQLLLYRIVYYHGALAPSEVASAWDLAQYMLVNFALYLRVSGVFHLVVGMLHLFGFNLPETHFHYFLSSSINDFWRRINIYWKDFMLKVFYQPTFFRLRRGGGVRALIVSTSLVVGVTWFLHSYQWFWLRGTFPIEWQDGLFWGVLGVLMIANSLYESRNVRARGRRVRSWTLRGSVGLAARVFGTFTFICVLWSIWTCESLDEWLGMWSAAGRARPDGTQLLGLVLIAALLVAWAGAAAIRRRWEIDPSSHPLVMTSTLAALLVIGLPSIYGRLSAEGSDFVQSVKVARLNRLDALALQRGYYEDLLNVDRFNSELWRAFSSATSNWLPLRETLAVRRTDDFLMQELTPLAEIDYKGAPLSTNRWGMRDQDYPRRPPAGTRRVAVLGASYTMGAGVADQRTFEAVLEERWRRRESRVELLNFAVGGYSPLQRMIAFERKALDFGPQILLYVGHENETESLIRHLLKAHQRGLEPPFDYLRRLYEELGISEDAASAVVERRLRPHAQEILNWIYERLAARCLERGVRPIWVYLPTLEFYGQDLETRPVLELAERAGFEVVDLSGLYDDRDIFSLRIADWDHHPNELGHRLIADRLETELRRGKLLEQQGEW